MTWKPLDREITERLSTACDQLAALASAHGDIHWLPETSHGLKFAGFDGPEDTALLDGMILWIRTARDAGYMSYVDLPWLPSGADFHKSALFERIRSGLKPLPEPPPLGYACPWYALIEDRGPHLVTVDFDDDTAVVLQNRFDVLTRDVVAKSYLLKDIYHATSYRFRLRYNPDWKHPSGRLPQGGWFICNEVFDVEGAFR